MVPITPVRVSIVAKNLASLTGAGGWTCQKTEQHPNVCCPVALQQAISLSDWIAPFVAVSSAFRSSISDSKNLLTQVHRHLPIFLRAGNAFQAQSGIDTIPTMNL